MGSRAKVLMSLYPAGRALCSPKSDNDAAPYSITSSATASSLSGTMRPNVLTVWWLITSSNLDACATGRSAGFTPLRMRPA
jgi:hypothetical protein